ncbi:MAG: signal peptidase II [Calditrichaeota bacterium]|nr:MAG: signal peptidase II [Calditrichota bacterium]
MPRCASIANPTKKKTTANKFNRQEGFLLKILFVTFFIIVFDQATKLIIKSQFYLTESVKVFGDFVRLTYIENPGMAFGIKIAGPWFFTLFSIIASIIIFIYLYRMRREALLSRLSLALILGGAIGNLIDRFLYGRVVDFIDIGVGHNRWPIFNIADSAVTLGMVLLISVIIFEKDEQHKDQSELPVKKKELPESEERDIWEMPE